MVGLTWDSISVPDWLVVFKTPSSVHPSVRIAFCVFHIFHQQAYLFHDVICVAHVLSFTVDTSGTNGVASNFVLVPEMEVKSILWVIRLHVTTLRDRLGTLLKALNIYVFVIHSSSLPHGPLNSEAHSN